ncbi:MAG TPA: ferritin-like domain-containing protein [Clostridia bacterium]|nr:ferritin-like domain-containing protein [Clostridia bacterium]
MYQQQFSLKLPLLGLMSRQQFEEKLTDAIIGEATSAELYTRLLKEAPDKLHGKFLEQARDDELEHLKYFEKLYYTYMGTGAQYKVKEVQYPSYKEGIFMALEDELKTAKFYKDMQMSVKDQLIRDTFFFAMVDELVHATQLSTLFNKL